METKMEIKKEDKEKLDDIIENLSNMDLRTLYYVAQGYSDKEMALLEDISPSGAQSRVGQTRDKFRVIQISKRDWCNIRFFTVFAVHVIDYIGENFAKKLKGAINERKY